MNESNVYLKNGLWTKLIGFQLSGFVAQLVLKALHWHCRGNGFKSRRNHLDFLGVYRKTTT